MSPIDLQLELTILKSQVQAAQQALAGAAALLEALQPDPSGRAAVSDPSAPCPHPSDQRRPMPVMGKPDQFVCGRCGELVEGPLINGAPTP
jgi:hypothetical protein